MIHSMIRSQADNPLFDDVFISIKLSMSISQSLKVKFSFQIFKIVLNPSSLFLCLE